jgi:pimeloyl-ACP methyl ester carboxylesterase
MRVSGGRGAIVLAAFALSGCAWMYPTAVPIHAAWTPRAEGERAPTLLVLLPGRGDGADAFAAHGFVDDVRASGAPVDVVAVDAHLGYYLKNTIVDRVWTDVIEPARRRGYAEVWVAGISMGGLGALALAREHGDALARVIVLAPFLGPAELLQQIAAAGGPARWTPTDARDPYQRLWASLKDRAASGAPTPKVQLAFGTSDRLASGHRLLAQLLPPVAVLEEAGGHDWVTWRKLWRRLWLAR